jgi:phosphoribosylformylglycinamidine synthase
MLISLYRRTVHNNNAPEECLYVDTPTPLSHENGVKLVWLLTTPGFEIRGASAYDDAQCIEIGPRLSVETSFSSNAVSVCQSMGIPVRRIEMSRRYPIENYSGNLEYLLKRLLDPLTQQVYERSLRTFDVWSRPKPVVYIEVLSHGEQALREANASLGLGMDDWDITFYTTLFFRLNRNPTDVELFQVGNANSEHSRHWFFRGNQIIDGNLMPDTLMDIVKQTLPEISNTLVAFHDNAGVIRGCEVEVLLPKHPGYASEFVTKSKLMHLTSTAETHNHPTLIAPFQGAETGAGGRIRDNRAVGRGWLAHAGFAGYCVGNLHIRFHTILGENVGGETNQQHATPLDILIRGSNGISDYGNKIGEPLIGGFTRTFGLMLSDNRREFRKPVLYSAGTGRIFEDHVTKRPAEKGMLIIRIGGPAYRIGVGGGSASSILHGAQDEGLDLQSVQRGNAEMENRVNRVIQTCCEMREDSPIESIHDQGAGGPSNVITELMEPAGGRVDIRKIVVGDKTMSILEIWVAEYQEGYGLLVRPNNLDRFKSICDRECVTCEVLGEITGDGNVVVVDSEHSSPSSPQATPVNLSLTDILSEMPRKQFESNHMQASHPPLVIPPGLTVNDALQMIFTLPSVGSKGFLVHKVDRSVTGLVARQQCCGVMQISVADVAVTANSFADLSGAATAFGEQPIKMLIASAAGARMAVAEMLTNMCAATISQIGDIACRANWMWAAKLPGEGALLYDAAIAMRDCMHALGISINGGKDSLSMATQVDGVRVVSPGQLVIKGIAPVPDITKIVTPDFKGSGCIGYIKIAKTQCRLGGSALAQSLGQIGDESPDLNTGEIQELRRAFVAMQKMIGKKLVTAYHDVSDGGLITTISEMCMAGNRGARIRYSSDVDTLATLFSEEVGMVFEFAPIARAAIARVLKKYDILLVELGTVESEYDGNLTIFIGDIVHLDQPITVLRQWWEATSSALDALQSNPHTVASESKTHASGRTIEPHLTFSPKMYSPANFNKAQKPKVAIVREEGTNGDREMAAACHMAGLDPWDVDMQTLEHAGISFLDSFRGIIFPGGFSYADVFGSAKGWAGKILFNPQLKKMFDRFYDRADTFSLGVCNGCQLMALLGRVPFANIPEPSQPRLLHNTSQRFESRWSSVQIQPSPSIFLRGMEGSILGMWVAHGEGRFTFPDETIKTRVEALRLKPLVYVDPDLNATEVYPYNPNGSPDGIAALCSEDGRHLAMMPHPERCVLKWQWPVMPESFKHLECSPWLQLFVNARDWCEK